MQSQRSVFPHRLLHDAFVTHSVCQGLKCDFYVRVCVETPIVWLLWYICLSTIFVDLHFPLIPKLGFSPVCSVCLPRRTRKSLLLVVPLPVCCQDWPRLPAAPWQWCPGWSRGWEGRPAPDWSRRYLVQTKRTSSDIWAASAKCKEMICTWRWYWVDGQWCRRYGWLHGFHAKSLFFLSLHFQLFF